MTLSAAVAAALAWAGAASAFAAAADGVATSVGSPPGDYVAYWSGPGPIDDGTCGGQMIHDCHPH